MAVKYDSSEGGSATGLILKNDSMYVTPGTILNSMTVDFGGDLYITDGGSADIVTVNSGGDLFVSSGGTATQVKENGGCVQVDDGARVTFVANTFSSCDYNDGAWATVHSGTTAVSTTVNDSAMLYVYSGGIASNTIVNNGGCFNVFEDGAVADGLTVNTGAEAAINGKLTGKITFEAGASLNATGSPILDFDLTQTMAGAAALVNDLSFVIDKPFAYTLTVAGTEADGQYSLAGGVSEFDKTITVVNTSGETLGSLSVAGGTQTIGDKKYTLGVSDSSLSVTIGEKTPGIITGDLTSECILTSGMIASSVNILDGGHLTVSNGGLATVTTVNDKGRLAVSTGGVASDTTIEHGGYVVIEDGAVAHQIKENGGWVHVAPDADATFVKNSFSGTVLGSRASVHSGTTAVDVVVGGESAAFLDVYGGIASNTTVGHQGILNLFGGEANTVTLISGGGLVVEKGAKVTGRITQESGGSALIEDGAILDFDLTQTSASGAPLLNDMAAVKFEGAAVFTLTVAGTEADGQYSLAGGVSEFDKTITVVNTSGETLGSLSVAGGTQTIGDKKYTLGVSDSSLSVTIGEKTPGIITGDLTSECILTSGMIASSVNILDGGHLTVSNGGLATVTTVNDKGRLAVSAGGVASDTTIEHGGYVVIEDGAVAHQIKENGGWVHVAPDADATFVKNSFSGTVLGSRASVHSGTTAVDVVVGGESAAFLDVYGGIASNTTVDQHGMFNLFGGEANTVTLISGGGLVVEKGAKVTGKITMENSGSIVMEDGAILDFDLTQTSASGAPLLNDMAAVKFEGAAVFTLTVAGTEADGKYSLAGNVSEFDKTITVVNTSGETLGSLAVGETLSTDYGKYALTLTDDLLAVNITPKSALDTTPPTITVSSDTTEPAEFVTVTAIFADDVAVASQQYRIGDGEWQDYTAPFAVTENVIISFQAADTSDNTTLVTFEVTNIVKGIAEPQNDWLYKKSEKKVNTVLTESVGTRLEKSDEPIKVIFDATPPSETLDNFVGQNADGTLDEYDYAKVVLDHGAELSFKINYTDAAKFTIWQLVPDKKKAGVYSEKSVQATTLKNKTATLTEEGTKLIRLEAGEYYLSMQSTNAKKGGKNEYSVTLAGATFFDQGDNSDDWTNMQTVGYGEGAEIDDLGVVNGDTSTLIENEWTGFGDAVDYKKITLAKAAKLNFAFTTQGNDAVKFSVCQLKATEKKGVTTYSQGWNKAATVKAKDSTGSLNDLMLAAGEYYIKVENSNAKKSVGTGYDVKIAQSYFYSDGDSNTNDYDSKAKAVSAEVRGKVVDLEAGKPLQLDGVLDADEGLVIDHDGKTNFVGFGDVTDVVRVNAVAGDSLSLKVTATDAVSLAIYGLQSNGKLKALKTVKVKGAGSVQLDYTLKAKDGSEFFVGVEATNAKKGEEAWYNVDVLGFSGGSADALAMTDNLSFGQYGTDVLADASAGTTLAELDDKSAWQSLLA